MTGQSTRNVGYRAGGLTRRQVVALAAATAVSLAVPALSYAQDGAAFPAGPVRIIVPLAPGGSVDLTARLVAEKLTTILGQSVIVENMPGGGGTIGATAAAEAAPDGYTLLMGSSSSIAVNPSLIKNIPYDPRTDFEAVSLVSYAPNVLVVNGQLEYDTVEDLVAAAKERPGELNFASSGIGGSPHLAGELFQREAGVELLHVPYKSSGQSLTDVLGGRVEMTFATAIATREHIESGALKALAVTTPERVGALPDVPTTAEAGYPGVQITAWNGLLAPAGTPADIVSLLSKAVQEAVTDTDLKSRLEAEGSTTVGNTPEEFKSFIATEIDRWAAVIKEANITVE